MTTPIATNTLNFVPREVDILWKILRNGVTNHKPGLSVRDKNYPPVRCPGNAHKFASEFLAIIKSASA